MSKHLFYIPALALSLVIACASPVSDAGSSEVSQEKPQVHTEVANLEISTFSPEKPPVIEVTPTPIPPDDPNIVYFKHASIRNSDPVAAFIIDADEFEKLNLLTHLKVLDLTGSTCYEQIISYIDSHPSVDVRYSVALGGVQISHNDEVATVPSLADPSLLQFLPNLKELTVTEPLTPESASALANRSTLELHYSVVFAGLTVPNDVSSIDLSTQPVSALDEIKQGIAVLPSLEYVNLNNPSWTLEQASDLQKVKDGLRVDYPVTAFGRTFSLADKSVDLSGISMKKNLQELQDLLPYLGGIQELYLDNCGLSYEKLAELRSQYASPKIVWLVKIGAYTCHTNDVMIKFSAGESKTLKDKDVTALKYCNEIRFLDLGHNHLKHIDFVSYMPDLEVCIIAVNYLRDIKGIENCKKLEYCEFLSGIIKDISPLAACTELKHLNVGYNVIDDISPLYGLKKLERLWISRNNIPKEQIDHIRELLPNCEINTTAHNPTSEGWRVHPRYELLKEQFIYDNTRIRSYNAEYLANMKFTSVTPTPIPVPETTPAQDTQKSETP